jgi:hypothetical protein
VDALETLTEEMFAGPEPLEASLVELVLAASAVSEDENEIFDWVDGLLAGGRVRLRPHLRARAA